MSFMQALTAFNFRELRALCKVRKLKWYGHLTKKELAYRLFGDDPYLKRGLCCANQIRRYKLPEPMDSSQWE